MIGERIKWLRKSKNLTQQAFAAALNSSSGYISEIESDKKMPGGDFFLSLKREFNVDLNWLLSGDDNLFASEASPPYGKTDLVTEKINQHLNAMSEDQKRDVLKYTEEKKLLAEFLAGKQRKRG